MGTIHENFKRGGFKVPLACLVLLALGVAFQAGDALAESNGNGGSSSTNTGGNPHNATDPNAPPPVTGATQAPFDPSNGINVDFDGNPSQIDGSNHNIDGSPATDQSVNVPAIGMPNVTGTYVNGAGGGTGNSGITTTGGDAGSLVGGITNGLLPKDADLERFIQSAKNSADYTLDSSDSATNHNTYGTLSKFAVVYAKPSNLDHETQIHFSGSGTSYGVLIIEVNNPAQGGLAINANYNWVGLVLVVVNNRDTSNINPGNGTPVDLRGSGGNGGGHIIGGAMVYLRNQGSGGYIYGDTIGNTSGGGTLNFSHDALTNAKVKSSFQVKSWRKLDE